MVAVSGFARWLPDGAARLVRALRPARTRPVKQTKVARELRYLDPPDAAPAGVRERR